MGWLRHAIRHLWQRQDEDHAKPEVKTILQETVSCFGNVEATQEETDCAGNGVMLRIFNGKTEMLTTVRDAEWHMMVLGRR